MADLFYLPFRPAIDANGLTVSGAELQFYTTGTTTPLEVFADAALTTPLENPVTANSAGVWPAIYLQSDAIYRVVLRDADGVTLNDVDPYYPGSAAEATEELLQAAADAAISAATAEAAAGPSYASTAAGLAATTSGEAFAVDAGDGTVTVYLNSAGVAVAQRNLATVAYNNARYPLKIGPEFTLSGAFTYSADFFNPTDDYVRSDCMVRATDSGSHPGKIRFGQFISADSGGTSPNGPANAFVGFGLSNIKTNFLSSTTTQETDGLFIQTKTGRFGDTSAILADAWAVNVPGVSTSFSNLIEGAAGCFDTSGVVVSKIRFQAGNQYQAGTPGSILGVGCHIIAEVGAQYSALDIDNTPGVGSWTYAMRVEKDGVQKFQIFSNGYVGINGTANIEIPLLVNADVSSELAARFYSTDAGPGEGPIVNLFRESATPANNDSLGLITFDGMDSANTQTTFAAVRAVAVNVTNGSEQGGLYGLVNSNGSLVQTFAAFRDSFYISGPLLVNGVQVIGPRKTGWGTPTGTATRTTFDTATVTTAQLAERLKALIDDLILHGVIGA